MNEFLLSIEHFRKQVIGFFRGLDEQLHQRRVLLSRVVLALIALLFMVYLIGFPIKFMDSDMWYHLAGGRYTWENWSVNNSTFFSFVSPEREWINYFWGFQVLLYKVHELFGYHGLIGLRVVFYTAIMLLVIRIILHGNKGRAATLLQLSLIALVLYLIVGRVWAVRPHMVSYLFILVFIYTLFINQKRIYLLPLFTLFWINLHGIEWVVGGLICGAFVSQRLFEYMQSRDRASLKPVVWVLLCLPVMFINPYGYEILTAPFNVTGDAVYFIGELDGLNLSLYNMVDSKSVLTEHGVILMLVFAAGLSLFMLWISGQLSLAYLILAVGGFLLLSRGYRFVWEWVLLLLPVLALMGQSLRQYKFSVPYYTRSLFIIYLLLSLTITVNRSVNFERYPLDDTTLPVATTQFIKQMDVEGRYIVSPNFGGYLEWELLPDVKIFMDMEFPPFDESDYLKSLLAQYTENGLNRFIDEYQPELLGIMRENHAGIMHANKHKDYVPVLIDDRLVLFIDKNAYPEVAQKYEIKHLNPMHGLLGYSHGSLDENLKELERILSIDKRNPFVLSVTIMALLDNHLLERARPWIDIMVQEYAFLPVTFYMAGIARYYEKDFEASIRFFNQALSNTWVTSNRKRLIYKQLGLSYYQLEDYGNAYEYFEKSINMYHLKEKNETYYQYAYAAFIVDDIRRAERLSKLIMRRATEEEEVYQNAQDLLKVIEKGEYDRAFWKW